MSQPLQSSSLPIRLLGTTGFLPGLIAHVKSTANTQNLPLDNVIFQSILLCLIAGGRNVIFRVPEEDISLVVKLATWTLAHVFGVSAQRLKLKHVRSSHLNRTSSSMSKRTSPATDPDMFLQSILVPPATSLAPHPPYSPLTSPMYEAFASPENHTSSKSSPFHHRSQSAGRGSSLDASTRLNSYPFPPVPQHAHSNSAGSDSLQHFQGGDSLLMHTSSTATNYTSTSANTATTTGAHPPLVKPRPLYAYDAPPRLRHSNSQSSGRRRKSGHGIGIKSLSALELPKAFVVSGLEHASEEVQSTFATVLRERRVVIQPHAANDGHETGHDKEQDSLGGDWELPDGFIAIYVCPLDPKERPRIHKSLLDHFAMSTNVSVPQTIRNEFKTYYLPPPSPRTFHSAFGSTSTPGSPSGMPHMSLPSNHTPPAFNKPLPSSMHHRTTSSSSQNHMFNPPALPSDIIPASFIATLQEAQRKVYISPYMSLYMADIFSAVRNHHRVEGNLITRRAMIQAEALVKACRVVGVDLTGMELVRPPTLEDGESDVASSLKDRVGSIDHVQEHDYLSVNMGYGAGTTINSMNTSKEHYPLLAHSPTATAEGEYPSSSRHVAGLRLQEPEMDEDENMEGVELDVTEVDVARIVPRVVSHRLRIRDGPDDEVLSGAVFSATWKFKLKPEEEAQRGEEKEGREPRLAYDDDDKLQTVKAVLVQILSQV